jgi:hypothetical protein
VESTDDVHLRRALAEHRAHHGHLLLPLLPHLPRETAAAAALLAPSPRNFPPNSCFAPPTRDFAGSWRDGPICPRHTPSGFGPFSFVLALAAWPLATLLGACGFPTRTNFPKEKGSPDLQVSSIAYNLIYLFRQAD